jgi:hypothetical protein
MLAVLALGAADCQDHQSRSVDTALVDLALGEVQPPLVLPGTILVVTGDSFVDDPWGTSKLRLLGRVRTVVGTTRDVDLRLPATFVDFQRLEVALDAATIADLGSEGATFDGTATVEVRSAVDGTLYRSSSLDISLAVHDSLTPTLAMVPPEGLIFPNEPLNVAAQGLLLPGEGETVAEVTGCFTPEGASTCSALGPVEVPVVPESAFSRDRGSFAFKPRIAGIGPGQFEGSVRLRNRHAGGVVTDSASADGRWTMERPIIYGASTDQASLGQFVDISGAGFVGGGEGDTTISFTGTFTPDSTGSATEVDVLLIPEFVDGHLVRYVLAEEDNIGQLLDVRFETGQFTGTFTPETAYADQRVTGSAADFSFRLAPVRQVVYLNFLPAYVESLRHFGLRAVDQLIRQRVVEVIERDFAGANVQVRTEPPQDYALYARVDVGGPDPNGLGLLGYDNSPGKDTENQRLYDRIGGVNAETQEDGYPGYGGIFLESLFGYSADPGGFAEPILADPLFDALFDPFRPDRGGSPVLGADLAEDVPTLTSGVSCPIDGERRLQVACAVWAMGSIVGSTISHEIGHSLGLADPYGPFFHNSGDQPNRLMDADRPFPERAEVDGDGPSRFCVDEYDYLRAILPTEEPYDVTPRAPCF